jgi:hypothetical protein
MSSRHERFGLWLAYWVLRLTGNRVLANVSRVLPLIPKRRLATALEPLDLHPSELLRGEEWCVWDPSAALGRPLRDLRQ